MAFLIIASDHTDNDALARRLAARPDHLLVAKAKESEGILQFAGATVDEKGRVSGSVLVVNVPTKEDAAALAEADVYWSAKVWASYTVQEIRVAIPTPHI